MKEIIGISGYATSGKDTIADYLVKNYGFKKAHFSAKLKELLMKLNPLVPDDYDQWMRVTEYLTEGKLLGLDEWDYAKKQPEIRRLLQELGTRCRELFGKGCWGDVLFKELELYEEPIVIPDVRFTNEANRIREKGGVVWRVTRPGVGPINKHESETALDTYPYWDNVINNNGSLDELYETIEAILIGDISATS